MKYETKFLISHRPYAIDPDSLKVTERKREDGTSSWHATVWAVWFRRKNGVNVACIGTLWDIQDSKPKTAWQFAEQHDDGRYGGNTHGRWDGSGYWGDEDLEIQAKYLEVLRPMLENYPDCPYGWDGWWTFHA